jgi:5-methylcytosine-specific restriction endonuclease McrA
MLSWQTNMPTKPLKHSLPKLSARSHAAEVYDKQTRRLTAGLRVASDLRSSSFWKKVRLTYISRNPICENPHGWHDDFPPLAQEVHHKISLQKAPHLAFKHSNLMSLCCKCHAKFSQEERSI